MDSLLKVIAVSIARERAKAILKLQQNLRIYPHEEIREVLTQEQWGFKIQGNWRENL